MPGNPNYLPQTKPAPAPSKKTESLSHAVTRMRSQGYTDDQIRGQIKKWHPTWDDGRVNGQIGGTLPGEQPTNVPALQPHGVAQDITQTNQDVQGIVDAHEKQMGYKPSPGLVFDLLRSKSLLGPTVDWHKLFADVPSSQRDANVQRAVQPSDAPYNFHPDNTYVRKDGLLVRAWLPSVVAPTTVHDFHKDYPTVEAGMLPLPNASSVYEAFNRLTQFGDNTQVKEQGMSWEQASDLEKKAQGKAALDAITEGKPAPENPVEKNLEVTTIAQAQRQLNSLMGTKLPVTGYFNDDWKKGLSDWMKTKDYFQRTAEFQAKQAGFKSYGSFLKAFKAKQDAVKHNGLWSHFINALPLQAFDHGTNPFQVAKAAVLSPFANPQFDVSYPLHTLTRSGSVTLDVVGGTVEQAKADAQAANAFMEVASDNGGVLGNKKTLDEAKAKAKKALEENPSWLRIFYPDLPEKESKRLAIIDGLTNVAGDVILLGGPKFTGESVRAGSASAARQSRYVTSTSHFAFNSLAKGQLGRGAALLEGGAGGERLAAAAAPAIQKGRMTEEIFQRHVAELYATGRTTIVTLPKEKEGVVEAYHGTTRAFDKLEGGKGEYSAVGLLGSKGVYLTDSPAIASRYTTFAARGGRGESANVRLHRVDTTKMFDATDATAETDTALLNRARKRIAKNLSPEELDALKNTNWESAKTNFGVYQNLVQAFADKMGLATGNDIGARDEAARVLEQSGYSGIIMGNTGAEGASSREFYVFNPEKHLLPRFPKPIEVTVTGPLLASLRTRNLTTPSKLRLSARVQVRDAIDDFDKGMRASAVPGTTNAADFTSWLRSKFAHAAPKSPRAYYDPKLPERVHDFVLKHFGSAELANDYESAIVRARAAGNTPRIQKIEGQLQSRYYRKYSLGPGSPIEQDPFSPLLESEAGSRFHFPAGNRQPIKDPFDAIAVTANGINTAFNKGAARFRRLLIISPSLFYKHAIGDTLRRIVGGDSDVFGVGLKESKGQIAALVDANPELARRWGSFLDRTTNSEVYYMAEPGEQTRSFMTGDYFNNSGYMRGAGRSLRQMLDDNALAAFRKSTSEDVQPLIDMIESNHVYRRLWSAAQRDAAEKRFGKLTMKEGKRTVGEINDSMQRVVRTQGRREMYDIALPVETFAENIFNRYKAVEEAAQAQGTSLDDAKAVLRAHRGGHADEALGGWIADNRVDYHVASGLVTPSRNYDSVTASIVKKVMSPNKKNREMMARSIAASSFRDLRAAGWNEQDALHTAMDVAEKQTIYHMLDFSNMLQIEQDLRWLVFFGTKHRLYWKWVVGALARNPQVPAVIEDAKQHLDDKGNFNFTLFGHKLAVPAARLVWVPGKEYPETSPFAAGVGALATSGGNIAAGANALAGPLSSGLQRNVVPVGMLIKLARMDLGNLPATYDEAASGLDATNATYLRRSINHFQMDYFAAHGHYAPQAQAVKHALLAQAAEGMWRSNLPLPVIPQNPNDTQKLLDQYMSIHDPAKRTKFLDAHPELAQQFGVSSNPADYTHLRTYWSQFTQALDQRSAIREQIYQQAKANGHMTQALEEQRHKADQVFSDYLDKLKKKDRDSTDLARQKEVNGEVLGIWGQQLAADPLTNPAQALKTLYPNLAQKELDRGLPSHLVKDAQRELDLLNDPAWVAKTFADPSEARTRKRELLQFIEDFRNYPKDALAKVESDYVALHVNPYWKKVEAFNAQIAKMGRGDKDTAYAKLRAWKDEQDKPVTINGITFPSPIAAAWQNLPPDLYKQRVAALATGSWDHLADYEKKLLGYHPDKGVSQGWETYTESVRAYHQQYPGQNLAPNQLAYLVQAIDKENPGFAKDYKFSKLPTLQRFEQLAPFKEMPQKVKVLWDAEIQPNADVIAKAYASKGYRAAELRVTWENYVKTDVLPYVDQHPALKRFLAPYLLANPDFLNTLPVS